MLRSSVVAFALVCVGAGAANAQTVSRDETTLRSQVKAAFAHAAQPATSVAPARSDGRLRLTPPVKTTLTTRAAARVRTASPAQSSGKKSFFKTPWPYVIIAAVVVIAVAVAASGGSGGGY